MSGMKNAEIAAIRGTIIMTTEKAKLPVIAALARIL